MEWTMKEMKIMFKGHELLKGDLVDIDGVLFIVEEPITSQSTGRMKRLTGIEVLYKQWWKNLLVKWHFMQPNMIHETITLYYNNTYRVLGHSVEILNHENND